MYSFIITATGWTYEYIDEHMDFYRFKELTDYWMDFPPTHLEIHQVKQIAAAMAGITLPGHETGIDASKIDPRLIAGAGVEIKGLNLG